MSAYSSNEVGRRCRISAVCSPNIPNTRALRCFGSDRRTYGGVGHAQLLSHTPQHPCQLKLVVLVGDVLGAAVILAR